MNFVCITKLIQLVVGHGVDHSAKQVMVVLKKMQTMFYQRVGASHSVEDDILATDWIIVQMISSLEEYVSHLQQKVLDIIIVKFHFIFVKVIKKF